MNRYTTVTYVGRRHTYRILTAIDSLSRRDGYPPSIRAIGNEVGIKSSSQVHGYLSHLREQGYVTWIEKSPRTLRLTERGRQALL